MQYKVVGFERIGRHMLEPHPSARLPMDADDADALATSIDELGVLAPLLVTAKPTKDGVRQILDGVNRWERGMLAEYPCVLVECDDPRQLALTCLGTGRKRSAGQRVMAYLEMHREKVLKVAEIVGDGTSNSIGVRRSLGVSRDTPIIPTGYEQFTVEKIAKHLGVSNKDVGMGVELLKCMRDGMRPGRTVGHLHMPPKPLDPSNEEDQVFFQGMQTQYGRLLAGGAPIRKWKAAVAGKIHTEGQGLMVDYGEVGAKAVISLRNVINHWQEMAPIQRTALAEDMMALFELARKKNVI